MANYKVIEGKIYKEVANGDIEQLKNKVEQVCQVVAPKLQRIEQLKAEIRAEEAHVNQYLKALENDIELVKAAFPDKAKQLGFLTQSQA